ncbi:Serine/threonine-protein kinase MARK1 [Liparis tanakae]|uniref:Serine/threonine-protein kinase MARK1 n=1 Tax=Liparis tanakae TaxID=230148 RepID=A0A4Z2G3R2_9TELE|nr:Serine/threonine-protein kinase MARK1 [Liparis tanakae]
MSFGGCRVSVTVEPVRAPSDWFPSAPLKTSDGLPEPPAPPTKSSSRHSLPPCRGGVTSAADEQQPHVGNYRLLKTIGKGNFAKVKLAKHTLTGREVSRDTPPVEHN